MSRGGEDGKSRGLEVEGKDEVRRTEERKRGRGGDEQQRI